MARISQDAATDISCKIVQKIQDQINATEKEIEDYIIPIYEASIPLEMVKMYKKYPEWMHGSSGIYLEGAGLSRSSRYTSVQKSYPSGNSGTPSLKLSNKDAAVVQKLEQKKEKLQEKYKKTKSDIKNTLLSLGTYKRALEAIPEILPYIPAQGGANTGIMLVPAAVREVIQCLASTDSKCVDKI